MKGIGCQNKGKDEITTNANRLIYQLCPLLQPLLSQMESRRFTGTASLVLKGQWHAKLS